MERRCDICTFWEPTDMGYGKCLMIKEKIEIELVTGWDGGYVKHIETEADFGCNLHQFLNE
jgi:hypothetical protein